MNLWTIAFIVLALNIPFGYWRANTSKGSLQWFLAIHAPVPLVIFLRVLAGLGWQLLSFPVLIGAFFAGQYLGGMLYQWRRSRSTSPVTSCLVWDVVRQLQAL